MAVHANDIDPVGAADSSRPMRADARRNRDRVLAAGREVFRVSGAEAQMDDVARAAGVGVGTVYRHFPTKEALMGEIVRQTFADFANRAEDAVRLEGSAFDALSWLLHRNAEQLAGDAATRYALGGGTAVWDAAKEETARLEELAEELLDRGRTDGTLRADLAVSDIGMVMCGLASGIGRGFDWNRHLELMLDGFRGRTPALG